MEYQLVEIVRIVMVVLMMWGIGLTYSTCHMIRNLLKIRGRCRKEDVLQIGAAAGFPLFAGFVLFFKLPWLAVYMSALMAICVGTLFAYIYITERQLHHCKAISELAKTKTS